jgi:uncharacterized coiled-coil DUF342 family protein
LQTQAVQKAREGLKEVERSKNEIEKSLSELKNKRTSLFAELKATLDSYQAWLKGQGNVG